MLMPPKQHEMFGAPLAASGTDGHLVPVEAWGNRPERRWNPEAALLSSRHVRTAHMREPRPGFRVDGVLG